MILAKGKLYGEEEREVLLARLEDEINETRVRAPLRSETVIAALDALGRHIENGQFDAQLAALGLSRRTDAVRPARPAAAGKSGIPSAHGTGNAPGE